MSLPTCGVYRTTAAIGAVPAGRLVYFHNHGEPGAGIYLPGSWQNNRAVFRREGVTLRDDSQAASLHALPPEGFYVVERAFTCCSKACRTYAKDELVQLGYNGDGQAIIFVPSLSAAGLVLPERGTLVEDDRLARLRLLRVAEDAAGVN